MSVYICSMNKVPAVSTAGGLVFHDFVRLWANTVIALKHTMGTLSLQFLISEDRMS